MRLPSVALSWSLEAVAKAGTISIIGVYGEVDSYPIGKAMEKNLTLTMATAIIGDTFPIWWNWCVMALSTPLRSSRKENR